MEPIQGSSRLTCFSQIGVIIEAVKSLLLFFPVLEAAEGFPGMYSPSPLALPSLLSLPWLCPLIPSSASALHPPGANVSESSITGAFLSGDAFCLDSDHLFVKVSVLPYVISHPLDPRTTELPLSCGHFKCLLRSGIHFLPTPHISLMNPKAPRLPYTELSPLPLAGYSSAVGQSFLNTFLHSPLSLPGWQLKLSAEHVTDMLSSARRGGGACGGTLEGATPAQPRL